jgi:hypothetical protein
MGMRWRQAAVRLGRALVSLVALAAAACDGPSEVCAGIGAPGLAVTVTDSLTGAPAAAGATLVATRVRGGAYADSATGDRDDQVLYGADDRPGVYDVTVRKAGYREWHRAAVEVRDGCPQVQTVPLAARLTGA